MLNNLGRIKVQVDGLKTGRDVVIGVAGRRRVWVFDRAACRDGLCSCGSVTSTHARSGSQPRTLKEEFNGMPSM